MTDPRATAELRLPDVTADPTVAHPRGLHGRSDVGHICARCRKGEHVRCLGGVCTCSCWDGEYQRLDRHADALATLAATYGRVFLSVAQR